MKSTQCHKSSTDNAHECAMNIAQVWIKRPTTLMQWCCWPKMATHLNVPQWYVANYGFDCSALNVGFTRHRAVLHLQKSSVTFDVSIFCGEWTSMYTNHVLSICVLRMMNLLHRYVLLSLQYKIFSEKVKRWGAHFTHGYDTRQKKSMGVLLCLTPLNASHATSVLLRKISSHSILIVANMPQLVTSSTSKNGSNSSKELHWSHYSIGPFHIPLVPLNTQCLIFKCG